MENDKLSVSFDEITGEVISVYDKIKGHEYIKKGDRIDYLYEMRLKRKINIDSTSEHIVLTSIDSSDTLKYDLIENGEEKTMKINFEHWGVGITVECTITLKDDELTFKINVQNSGNLIIRQIIYPNIKIRPFLGEPNEVEYFLGPYHTGNLYKNISGMPITKNYYSLYPNHASTQMMAYFNKNFAIYSQTKDINANYKNIGFSREHELDLTRITYIHYTGESFGNSFEVPYYISFRFLSDCEFKRGFKWFDFTDIYKKWAHKAFNFVPLRERKDLPDFLLNLSVHHYTWATLTSDRTNEIMHHMQSVYRSEPYPIPDIKVSVFPGHITTGPSGKGVTWRNIDVFIHFKETFHLIQVKKMQFIIV